MRETSDQSRKDRLAGLAVLTVVLVLSVRAIGFDFVWDDKNLIVDNDYLRQPTTAWQAFGTDFWELTNSPKASRMYRPLVILAYWTEYRLWGVNAWGYHLFNVLLLLWVTFWAFKLLRHLVHEPWAAALGAIVFALYPIQADVVGNIAGRTDLMASAFGLPAMWLYVRRPPALWAASLLFLLALLCKESAIMFPLLAVLLAWETGAPVLEKHWARWAPLLVWPAYGGLRTAALGLSAGSPITASGVGLDGSMFLRYVSRALIPTPMSPMAAHEPAEGIWVWVCLFGVALFIGLAVVRRLRFPVLWFTLALLPVSGLLPISARFADSLMHLAVFSVAVIAARLFVSGRVARVGACAVAVACALLFTGSLAKWKDDIALWSYGVSLDDSHPTMWMNLGNALSAHGDRARGCEAHGRALALAAPTMAPSGEAPYSEMAKLQYNVGNCLRDQGKPDEALARYREALRGSNGELHQAAVNAAVMQLERGEIDEATRFAVHLTEVRPDVGESWRLLGVAHARARRTDEAYAAFKRALELNPSDSQAKRMLGSLGRSDPR